MFDDFDAGVLTRDVGCRDAPRAVLTERDPSPVDWNGWRGIDTAERDRGADSSRPRVKFVQVDAISGYESQ